MKRKTKERLGYAALNLTFILLCLVTLIPIYYAVNVSFSGRAARSPGFHVPAGRPVIGKLPRHTL